MGRRVYATSLIGAGAVLSLALSSCSSSGNSKTGTDVGGTGSHSSASASPLLIGSEIPLTGQSVIQTNLRDGMEAAVSSVNAAGGISGHPLKLQICDTKFDANTELSCMRNLISDKVAAVVGGTVAADQSGREFELAEHAGIPVVGSAGDIPTEYSTTGVFPLSSGFVGWVYGAVANLVTKGATKIGILALDDAPGNYGVQLATAALAAHGMKPTTVSMADPGADPTFSTAAAKAMANGVDGMLILMTGTVMPKAITALQGAGYTGMRGTLTVLAGPEIIKAVGPAANGMYVTAQTAFPTDTNNAGIRAFLPDMHKYQPKTSIEEYTIQGWSAIKLLQAVLAQDSSSTTSAAPTSKQILDAFNNIGTTPIQLGTIGPFVKPPAKRVVPGFARMYSATVQTGVVKDGVLEPDGKGFVNPFAP
jgi:ABC-type branched-subunit amino acid transport system substrate-binding protein